MMKNSAPSRFIWVHIFRKAPTSEGATSPLRRASATVGAGAPFLASKNLPPPLKIVQPPLTEHLHYFFFLFTTPTYVFRQVWSGTFQKLSPFFKCEGCRHLKMQDPQFTGEQRSFTALTDQWSQIPRRTINKFGRSFPGVNPPPDYLLLLFIYFFYKICHTSRKRNCGNLWSRGSKCLIYCQHQQNPYYKTYLTLLMRDNRNNSSYL